MSAQNPQRRLTAPDIARRKGGTPIVALTAYHAQPARLIDAHCDVILVGDSLGMVIYGMPTTLPVTLDLMIAHGRAVVAASQRALVVVDMPFGSYEESPEQAFRNAARVMKETGAGAVKLEGGAAMAETIGFLCRRGIPVMAHIGLTPQSTHAMGGYKTQGRDEASWPGHEADAQAVAKAGAFAVVLEGMVEPLAVRITRALTIPAIGIGASAECDGQILVLEDMLGFNPEPPKFVKQFGDLGAAMERAVKEYADAVRARRFPGEAQTYQPKAT